MRTKKRPCDDATINRLIGKIDSGKDACFGYEKEKQILSEVLNRTFKSGDSGSVIIFGPRGSGKSTLLEATLADLKIGESSRRHYIIRLDGSTHSTDALAMNVIANVLEIQITNSSDVGPALQEKIKSSKSLRPFLFILNEIDVFCRRQQTLLYTLFDAIHNFNGICLVGLTAKTDCIDYVEKRVRSRMMYKTIVLESPFQSQEDYLNYVKEYLEGAIDPEVLKPFVYRQFGKSKTPGDMKRFCLDLLLKYKSTKVKNGLTIEDSKIQRLGSLAHLELAVIGLVVKRLDQTRKKIFRPVEILPLLKDVPSQITSSKELFLYVLNRLIDYGLLSVNNLQRSNSYISDWSPMVCNVTLDEVKTVLELNKHVLPTGFSKILGISC